MKLNNITGRSRTLLILGVSVALFAIVAGLGWWASSDEGGDTDATGPGGAQIVPSSPPATEPTPSEEAPTDAAPSEAAPSDAAPSEAAPSDPSESNSPAAPSESVSSEPTSTPSDTFTPLPDGQGVPADTEPSPAADQLVPTLVNTGPRDIDGLSNVASGALLDALKSQADEAKRNGWVQRGKPKVVFVEVTESRLDASPRSFDIAACLDSSGVTAVIGGQTQPPNPTPRSLNLYTVEELEGRWVLTRQSFPAEPDC